MKFQRQVATQKAAAVGLRSFECVTEDGREVIDIRDVIVHEDVIHLVCKGKREEPYIFEINPVAGIRAAHPSRASVVRALHEKAVSEWQHVTTS